VGALVVSSQLSFLHTLQESSTCATSSVENKQTNKQTNNQSIKQAINQTSNQTSNQTNKQSNKQTNTARVQNSVALWRGA
jgi:hypothetical protein